MTGFLAVKREIDRILAGLKTLSDGHDGTAPDTIHWGNVATLNYCANLFCQVTESAARASGSSE
jgi:hypothetical protein